VPAPPHMITGTIGFVMRGRFSRTACPF